MDEAANSEESGAAPPPRMNSAKILACLMNRLHFSLFTLSSVSQSCLRAVVHPLGRRPGDSC
jgi:hypothetical protein